MAIYDSYTRVCVNSIISQYRQLIERARCVTYELANRLEILGSHVIVSHDVTFCVYLNIFSLIGLLRHTWCQLSSDYDSFLVRAYLFLNILLDILRRIHKLRNFKRKIKIKSEIKYF